MRKIYLIIILIYLTAYGIYSAETDAFPMERDGKKGYWISEDTAKRVSLLKSENEYLHLQLINRQTKIELLENKITLLQSMNETYQEELKKQTKLYITNRILTFTTAFGITISIAEIIGILVYGLLFYYSPRV